MYTFDSFVVSEYSRAAFDAAIAVAENPGRVHNPLVLFGRSGYGKSHLLASIEHAMRARFPEMNILRASAHAFAAQLVFAIRAQSEEEVIRFDAILLDDFHFRGEKSHTEQTVVRMMERARAEGAQIVIASPQPRAFATATIVEVGPLDSSARVALARREAAKHGLKLSKGRLRKIARRSEGDPTRIRSAVARIAAATIPPCASFSLPLLPWPQSPSS